MLIRMTLTSQECLNKILIACDFGESIYILYTAVKIFLFFIIFMCAMIIDKKNKETSSLRRDDVFTLNTSVRHRPEAGNYKNKAV